MLIKKLLEDYHNGSYTILLEWECWFMNYYISDLHLFHKNVTREGKAFNNRPFDNLEDMQALIKEK